MTRPGGGGGGCKLCGGKGSVSSLRGQSLPSSLPCSKVTQRGVPAEGSLLSSASAAPRDEVLSEGESLGCKGFRKTCAPGTNEKIPGDLRPNNADPACDASSVRHLRALEGPPRGGLATLRGRRKCVFKRGIESEELLEQFKRQRQPCGMGAKGLQDPSGFRAEPSASRLGAGGVTARNARNSSRSGEGGS